MSHRRSVINLQSMGPKQLLGGTGSNDSEQSNSLSVAIRDLHHNISSLEQETALQTLADSCKEEYETIIKQAIVYGKWQVEALAIRRGVHLRPLPKGQHQQDQVTGSSGHAKAQLQAALDRQLAHVDRREAMPSPYMWQVLGDMEKRLDSLQNNVWSMHEQIDNSMRSDEPADILSILQSQHRALYNVTKRLDNLHMQVEKLRQHYRFYEKGENVLERARYEEQERERRYDAAALSFLFFSVDFLYLSDRCGLCEIQG